MTAEPAEQGAEGFYVTVKDGAKTGFLLGPDATKEAAEGRVPLGKRLAGEVDPWAAFYAFGVTRVQMQPGAELPPGVLNALAAEADKDAE